MKTAITVRLSMSLLALGSLLAYGQQGEANTGNQFGPAVDAFCAPRGQTPFADQSCALCHAGTNFATRVEPEWTWWEQGNATGNFEPFCPEVVQPPTNTAPIANPDIANTEQDTPVDVDVLANDTDADGDPLSVGAVTDGSRGTVTNNGSNVTYVPNPGFNGGDSFTYTVDDGSGGTDTASVSVTVGAGAPVNAPPRIISPANTRATAGEPYRYDVAASDPDAGEVLTFSLDVAPAGMAIDEATGLIAWTPDNGQIGEHDVTVTVTDSGGLSDSQVFAITVGSIPVATACLDNDSDLFSPEGGVCGPIDCDDFDAAVNPGMRENCDDSIDNDCDGVLDEDDPECNGGDCIGQLGESEPGGAPGPEPSVIKVREAEWDAEDSELKVEGEDASAGAEVRISDADSGALVGTTRVQRNGEWEFEQRMDPAAAPCRVRVVIGDGVGERDVEDAPAVCGTANPPPGNEEDPAPGEEEDPSGEEDDEEAETDEARENARSRGRRRD